MRAHPPLPGPAGPGHADRVTPSQHPTSQHSTSQHPTSQHPTPPVRRDDPVTALPTDARATRLLDWVHRHESAPIAGHSVRSYLFARRLAEHEGLTGEVDRWELFAACVLHDAGLTALADHGSRFEVAGADVAAGLLTDTGMPAAGVDRVWTAVALHTSPGIAERSGPLAYLVREGVGVDFGRNAAILSPDELAAVHAAHPRLGMVRSLVDDIVARARREPATAPRYSIAGELLRERDTPPHVTRMERGLAGTVWGD